MDQLNSLIINGIENGKSALIGPKVVQVDLTGICNNKCIGCWVHSSHVNNPPRDKNEVLPFERAKELIEDLAALGTEEIILSGAGEPFLYPRIMDVIELIKNNHFRLNIITNFSLIDKRKSDCLIDLGVDLITASVWSGTPGTYIKTHPDKAESDFYSIKNNLRQLSLLKEKKNKSIPFIKVYNVICSQNYNEISQMIDFAMDARVEFVEFQIMDIFQKNISYLALSSSQVAEIKQQFEALKKRNDLYFKELELLRSQSDKGHELNEFPGRFFKIPQGFRLKEDMGEEINGDKYALHSLFCPEGFSNLATKGNPLVEENLSKITFGLVKDKCLECTMFKTGCPVDGEGKISFKYTKILGFGSFLRRLSAANIYGPVYEKDLINNLPCYIGWFYSRVLSTGEVIPCCKAAGNPLGNIQEDTFSHIWSSTNYKRFRYNAKNKSKNNPYFNKINCYKSCDNVGMNLQIKELIETNRQTECTSLSFGAEVPAGVSELPGAQEKIFIPASAFSDGNFNYTTHSFGKGLIIDGGHKLGFAEYNVTFPSSGKYELWSFYAAENPRSVDIYFDGVNIKNNALNQRTPGWTINDLRWFKEGEIDIIKGEHVFAIRSQTIPHIHSFAFLKDVEKTKGQKMDYLSETIYPCYSGLKLLKDKFRSFGLFSSFYKLANYVFSGNLVNNYLDILGIFNGSYAFKGPFHVQIDLTYACNNNCIACWCNSPLLGERELSPDKKRQTLSYYLVRDLLDEFADMGVKEIYFSGGGEPFMHPWIMDILAYAKKKKFVCYVNTNFTLLDKEKIRRLIDIGLDHMTVSTWSATPETYAVTHPNKSKETFEGIIDNLKFLNRSKKRWPYIKLYNVIFNLNYRELKGMIDLAGETGSESVEFTLIDTIPGKTDNLVLSGGQIIELKKAAQEIARNTDKNGLYGKVLLFRFDSFLRRISSPNDLARATYDRNIIDRIPCYIGWCFSRIMPNGDVNACLKSHRIPVGNLYSDDFRQIWNGQKQQYFRKKTLTCKKTGDFFKLIGNDDKTKEPGCYKSCDDIGRNIYMHNRIMSLTFPERKLLKALALVRSRSKISSIKKLNLEKQANYFDCVSKGIASGRKAFAGPEQVVIDVTNLCNGRCIGCWLYSPLLKNKPDPRYLQEELDFGTVKFLIDSLAELGVKRVRFTGGGEPFMHRRFMEMVEYVKAKGLLCCITTNFSLVDKSKIKDLIKFGIDELAVSLWAADNDTYMKVHPGISGNSFQGIIDNLKYLVSIRKDKPFLTICNVICSLNYSGAENMFDLALKLIADGVYFTLLDSLPGTDSLLLTLEQKSDLLRQAGNIRDKSRDLPGGNKIKLDFFDGFITRLESGSITAGRYDEQAINKIPCYAGWIFSRVLADGTICPCCRGVNKPMGSIYKDNFKDIWFSAKYNEFRVKAKYLPKDNEYFSDIGCLKMCDNFMHNQQKHSELENIKS